MSSESWSQQIARVLEPAGRPQQEGQSAGLGLGTAGWGAENPWLMYASALGGQGRASEPLNIPIQQLQQLQQLHQFQQLQQLHQFQQQQLQQGLQQQHQSNAIVYQHNSLGAPSHQHSFGPTSTPILQNAFKHFQQSQHQVLEHVPSARAGAPASLHAHQSEVNGAAAPSSHHTAAGGTHPQNAQVGDRVCVYWDGERSWFNGTVVQVSGERGYLVRYDDNEEHWELQTTVHAGERTKTGKPLLKSKDNLSSSKAVGVDNEAGDVRRKSNARKVTACGICGLPKKGHVCAGPDNKATAGGGGGVTLWGGAEAGRAQSPAADEGDDNVRGKRERKTVTRYTDDQFESSMPYSPSRPRERGKVEPDSKSRRRSLAAAAAGSLRPHTLGA
jgi:hypothetical protein